MTITQNSTYTRIFIEIYKEIYMKEHLLSMKQKLMRCKLELFYSLCMIATYCSCVNTTYATPSSVDPNNLIKSIIEGVMDLFPAVGIVIALVGAFKLYMAFRNDQPDAYSNSIKDIVIGALLVAFRYTIWDKVLAPLL